MVLDILVNLFGGILCGRCIVVGVDVQSLFFQDNIQL